MYLGETVRRFILACIFTISIHLWGNDVKDIWDFCAYGWETRKEKGDYHFCELIEYFLQNSGSGKKFSRHCTAIYPSTAEKCNREPNKHQKRRFDQAALFLCPKKDSRIRAAACGGDRMSSLSGLLKKSELAL